MAGKIFVIADLHLSFGTDKPMDIFGKAWENHADRLEENWIRTVGGEDIVIIPGDLSWGLKEFEVLPDLEFIDKLPGQKILMKGNHELWWTSLTRLKQLREDRGLDTLHFLHNNAFYIKDRDIIVCGTRGWKCPGCEAGFDSNDLKIYKRELVRLQLSVDYGKKLRALCIEAQKNGEEIPSESMGVLSPGGETSLIQEDSRAKTVVCFHFPPFAVRGGNSGFTEIMKAEAINECYFGHLHGMGKQRFLETGEPKPFAVCEEQDEAIKCYLAAADFLELTPLCLGF